MKNESTNFFCFYERAYFEQFGKITDLFNCKNKGFCFVTMVDNGKNIEEILAKKKHEVTISQILFLILHIFLLIFSFLF